MEDYIYKKIDKLKRSDTVVVNNKDNIGNVISFFTIGLKKYYSYFRSVIKNADAIFEGGLGVFEKMKNYLKRWDITI